jgi:hypothetical protein
MAENRERSDYGKLQGCPLVLSIHAIKS